MINNYSEGKKILPTKKNTQKTNKEKYLDSFNQYGFMQLLINHQHCFIFNS